MRFFFLACLFQLLFFNILFSQTININSITWTRQSSGDNGYTLDGIQMISSRAKLLDTNNFSSSGTYPKAISIFDGYGTTGSLTQISTVPVNHIFLFGGFIINDGFTQPFTAVEIDSLYNWSKRGGKLIIAANANAAGYDLSILNSKWGFHDTLKVPSYLIPTSEGNSSAIFNGPFGTVSYANQGGYIQGYFDVIPANSKILATDPNTGKPTLFLDCNTLDLIAADVDVYTGLGGISTGSAINNMQDIFWANTITFMDKLQNPPVITYDGTNLSCTNTYSNYQWYLNGDSITGANNQEYFATQNGSYSVKVILDCGCEVLSNAIVVDISLPEDTLIVPNAFIPNGSGANAIFKAQGQNIKTFQGTIINRWGQTLYKWNDINKGWDGEYKGQAISAGAYFFVISVAYIDGKTEEKHGSVEVIR